MLDTGVEFKDFNFKQTKTASLLLIPHSFFSSANLNPSLMLTSYRETAIFLPLPFILKENDMVFLSFATANKTVKIPFGIVRVRYGIIGEIIFSADKNGHFKKNGEDWLVEIRDSKIFLAANGTLKNISITLQDKPILKKTTSMQHTALNNLGDLIIGRTAAGGEKINSSFRPYGLDLVYLRVKSGNFIDIENIEKEGNLDLVLKTNSAEEKRYPLFSYQVIPAGTDNFETAGLPIILR